MNTQRIWILTLGMALLFIGGCFGKKDQVDDISQSTDVTSTDTKSDAVKSGTSNQKDGSKTNQDGSLNSKTDSDGSRHSGTSGPKENLDDIYGPVTTNNSDASVWCFPEYYRVDPVSGNVSEYGFKPYDKSFPKSNSVYDQQKNVASLVAMKGETVAFQIMIEGDRKNVSLIAKNFPENSVKLYYEGYLHFYDKATDSVRYVPEVAVPLDWIGGTFDVVNVPKSLPKISGKRMQAIWVDVTIPRDAKTGMMYGSLDVQEAGKTISEIRVAIQVANVTIPEQPTFNNAMIQYSMFVKKYPQRELDAFRQMHDHRLSIHDVPYSSQRGWGIEGAVPVTTLSPVFEQVGKLHDEAQKKYAKGEYGEFLPKIEALKDPKKHTVWNKKDLEYRMTNTMPMHDAVLRACMKQYEEKGAGITDWTAFDKRYGPYFDGSAYDDGIPLVSFELPFNYNWPAPLDRFEIMDPTQSGMYEDIWVQVGQDFLKHAKEKDWTHTQFFVYNNPKDRKNNLAMWKGDEPTELKDFQAHKYWNDLFLKAFANPGGVKVEYKLEVGHWECDAAVCRKRELDSKTWDESNAREILKDVVCWVPNSHHFHSARKLAWKQMEKQGDKFYSYGGMGGFEQSSMAVYAVAFRGFEDRSLGYFYYVPTMGNFKIWRDNPGKKIKGTKYSTPEDNIAHYDAAEFGKNDKMLMSLRLKNMRGIEQHYAAFKLAQAKDTAFAEDLIKQTVKYVVAVSGRDTGCTFEVLNNNPEDLYTARLKAIAIASGDRSIGAGREYQGSIKGVGIKTDTFHYCVACGEACSPVKCEWCGAQQPKEAPPPGYVPPIDASKFKGAPARRPAAGEVKVFGKEKIVIEIRIDKVHPDRDLARGINVGKKADQKDYLLLEGHSNNKDISRSMIKFNLGSIKKATDIHSASLQLCIASPASSLPFDIVIGAAEKDFSTLESSAWKSASSIRIVPGSESIVSITQAGEAGKYVNMDVTQALRFMIANGMLENGFVIQLKDEKDRARIKYYSSSHSGGKNAPKLEVTLGK